MKSEATNIVIDLLLFLARNRFEKRAFHKRVFIGDGPHIDKAIEAIRNDVETFFRREQFPVMSDIKSDGTSTLLTVTVERRKRD